MFRTHRHWQRCVVPAAALALLSAAAHAAVLTKGPYIQNPGQTAITIQYETEKPAEGYVAYGAGGRLDRKVPAVLHEELEYHANSADKKSPILTACLYRARLTGLSPGTEYCYEVVPTGNPIDGTSGVRRFRTFPRSAGRVTFIGYGDSRTNPVKHAEVVANFARHDPAFILHTGDLVRSGSAYEHWGPQFFQPLADIIDHVPMMIAIGNHEGSAENLLRLFDLPGGRTYYSFQYGPVHVVVLDNDLDGPDVLAWLDRDLAAAKTPWKIAMYHNPTFNLGGHASDSNRMTFLPLLEKYGVDVVLAGHSHLYERFRPIMREGPIPAVKLGSAAAVSDDPPADMAASAVPRQPIMFVTSGGGGARLHSAVKHRLLAASAKAYHYCLFTVDSETLRMQAINSDGKEIDSFTLTKKDGRYDPSYIAQAISMEDVAFTQGVTRLAMPTVSRIPTEPQFTLSLKARFPRLKETVTVTVRLSDASAKDYQMEPVTAEVKPGKEATLRLEVKARRPVTTEDDKEDERIVRLRPSLKFMIAVKAQSFEQTVESEEVIYRRPEPKPGEPIKSATETSAADTDSPRRQ